MTPGGPDLGHFDRGMLSRYVDGDVSDEIEATIECHLADCDDCAAAAQRLFRLADTFTAWTAAYHGATWQAEILQQALRRAVDEVSNPLWRRRLQRWCESWTGKAEAALRYVMERAGESVRAHGQNVDSLVRAGSTWALAPAPQFGGTWGDDDETADSILFASQVLSPEKPQLLVELVGGAHRQVIVRVDGLPPAHDPPLVLLISLQEDSPPEVRVAEVEPLPQAGSFLTRFRKLDAGEYFVVIEPRESSTQET